jgi:hypothetical protein
LIVDQEDEIVMQLDCRVEVAVDDIEAVADLAVQRLRKTNIDWSQERNTLENAVAELRADLAQLWASLADPARAVEDVPGVRVRGGRWWVELGTPSERFKPGFEDPR